MYNIKKMATSTFGQYCPHLPPRVQFLEADGTDVTYTQPGAVAPESHAQTCQQCTKPRFVVQLIYAVSWRTDYPSAYKTEAEVLEDLSLIGGGEALSSRFFENSS